MVSRNASLADRSKLYKELASGPFFGYNRPAVKPSQGAIDSFWLQAMMAGHTNAFDCIKAFSETDFAEDLTNFDVARRAMNIQQKTLALRHAASATILQDYAEVLRKLERKQEARVVEEQVKA